jgi:NADPH2:quinone reductase
VDTYIRAGKYGPRALPYTPGSDAAGVVDAVGTGVTHVKVGDRVYTSATRTGAYAELVVAPASRVHPLPGHVAFQAGAAMGVPAATAYAALFLRGEARPGETVLVHGASGGVGTSAVQLGRAHGCTVIGTASTDEGRALVLREGAHHAVGHDDLPQILALTGGRGVDVTLEMLASENLGKVLSVVAKRGRVVVVGSRGVTQLDPRDTMSRNAEIRGLALANCTPEELTLIHAALHAALENKTLRPIIGKTFELADAAAAHREVIDGKAQGKIILTTAAS